ncbi:MAG: type IV secretory system conjugative DNA transfer family protein [Ruthenibacterium sp.]
MKKKYWILFLCLYLLSSAAVLKFVPAGARWNIFIIIMMLGIVLALMLLMFTLKPIDIKDKQAGHGQHGRSHIMGADEEKETFCFVPKGNETEPGFVIDYKNSEWEVDASEDNILLLAPPKAGKTTRIFITSIFYNAFVNINTKGKGASMIILDCKGELFRQCAGMLQKAGYKTPALDLRNILHSSRYNFIVNVNRAIDEYKAAADDLQRAITYGKAERYAKVAASQLIDNSGADVKSEASDYFNETARGLLTGIILLVSEYGAKDERHIISVFNLILEMNGQIQGQQNANQTQKTKLQELLEYIDNRRIMNYTGAATSADMRTSMNVFSSALGKLTKFIDAELEQLLCDHDEEFDSRAFIEQPTAMFFISPDENTTRHFMSSLCVRNTLNDTIEIAELDYGGKLPRKVQLYLDEFGQQPPIQDYDALSAAYRSRGGRFIIAIQDFAQLHKHYSKDKADIIKGTNQTLITSFVAPSALQTAETLSKIMGNETILTGSNTKSYGKISSSTSLVGRPLMSPSELITMPLGDFIVIKGGHNPLRIQPPGYWTFLTPLPEPTKPPLHYKKIAVASADSIRKRNGEHSYQLTHGMFD